MFQCLLINKSAACNLSPSLQAALEVEAKRHLPITLSVRLSLLQVSIHPKGQLALREPTNAPRELLYQKYSKGNYAYP